MNIFDQFGIKEVADATLYSIHKKQDGSGGNYFIPALFLDTLKISSVDKTANNVWAEGGQGNQPLVSWDYGKRINVKLEDALCTPAQLGLCWGGVLGADWKDADIKINTACEDINCIKRTEKAFFPRNDKIGGTVSRLLPHIKDDELSLNLDLLRISSIVDGTIVEGTGLVKNKGYKWRLAIESVVNSIAQVPDRFFDINGQSYPIDINRKVSVNSLPTYENYKDAIIYKINTKTKPVPPLAKIIFDYAKESEGIVVEENLVLAAQEESKLMLGEVLERCGYTLYADGHLTKTENEETLYFYPLRQLTTTIYHTSKVEDKFNYDINERLYQILDQDIINSFSPDQISAAALSSALITYNMNHAMTDLCGVEGQIDLDQIGSVEDVALVGEICKGDYLAIIVDNNNEYHALIGVYAQKDKNEPRDTVIWYKPIVPVDVSQFKNIDMWLRFHSLNEMIYFIITKYSEDIVSIKSASINANGETWAVDDKKTTIEPDSLAAPHSLWAYVNPRTMTPYDDDYWFHQAEPYLIQSITLVPKEKTAKAKRINIKSGVWPGMYMFIGETWIRNKDTGKDEHLQIKIPFCKVKSDNSLSLEAGGEPVTFSLELEVGKSRFYDLMEITTYETSDKLVRGEDGCFYAVDGASTVIIE